MAGPSPVELSVDCPACGLEGGVVEIYDALVAACRFGLPAATRCKLCGAAQEGAFDRTPAKSLGEIPANRCPGCLHELAPGVVDERSCRACGATAALRDTAAPRTFARRTDFERALDAWADRERFPSRDALVTATFAEPDVAVLFERLQRGEPLEILADPFANMGLRTTGKSRARDDAARAPTAPDPPGSTTGPDSSTQHPPRRHAPVDTSRAALTASGDEVATHDLFAQPGHVAAAHATAAEPPPPSAPPRAIVYPLVSVIAADGEIHPEERALIDRFLEGEGLAPLANHEFCVHHPSAVAHFVPKERREEFVKLMCETAAIDGMPDESERRVIRAYASAWDVDDEKLEFWMWGYETMNTSLTRQLFLKLRRFVLSARWGDEAS